MPPYELRLGGKVISTHATEEEAMAAASAVVREDADDVPEVLDAESGQPAAPAADRQEQEDLAGKVGF